MTSRWREREMVQPPWGRDRGASENHDPVSGSLFQRIELGIWKRCRSPPFAAARSAAAQMRMEQPQRYRQT